MSRTLSVKSGSPESLKVCERCGCSPKAFRMHRIVVCERPLSPAIERVDQWVASGGVVWSVRPTTYATRSSPTVRGRPDRGASDSPSVRSLTKRRRHLPTVRRSPPIPPQPPCSAHPRRNAGRCGSARTGDATPAADGPGVPGRTAPTRPGSGPPSAGSACQTRTSIASNQ